MCCLLEFPLLFGLFLLVCLFRFVIVVFVCGCLRVCFVGLCSLFGYVFMCVFFVCLEGGLLVVSLFCCCCVVRVVLCFVQVVFVCVLPFDCVSNGRFAVVCVCIWYVVLCLRFFFFFSGGIVLALSVCLFVLFVLCVCVILLCVHVLFVCLFFRVSFKVVRFRLCGRVAFLLCVVSVVVLLFCICLRVLLLLFLWLVLVFGG